MEISEVLKTKIADFISKGNSIVGNWSQIAYSEFRNGSLSLIDKIYSKEHNYYTEFAKRVNESYHGNVHNGIGILTAIKNEIEDGWLSTMKGLISADIFSDFLEMAEHLLSEDYKDAAAVMIGSVLEEHLRQLCTSNGINILDAKANPFKSATLNIELMKANVYNKIEQSEVDRNLKLRNSAAHGHYEEYDKGQVELMLSSVRGFILRHGIK